MATAGCSQTDDISESLDQWAKFCSTLRNRACGGEVVDERGLKIACCRTLWPLGNIAIFTVPVQSVADLERRIETAHSHFQGKGCRGIVCVADYVVECLRAQVPEVFARYQYVPIMTMMGMVTDALIPPVRTLPELEYRRVSDAAARRTVWELNALAYEVPAEWGLDAYEHADWHEPAFGIVGYRLGRPAACAAAVPVDGRLYMALVATAHEFRRLGCAEAVMRRALEEAAKATGLQRTVLHGTPMGRPLYAQMGYHDTLPFAVYAQLH